MSLLLHPYISATTLWLRINLRHRHRPLALRHVPTIDVGRKDVGDRVRVSSAHEVCSGATIAGGAILWHGGFCPLGALAEIQNKRRRYLLHEHSTCVAAANCWRVSSVITEETDQVPPLELATSLRSTTSASLVAQQHAGCKSRGSRHRLSMAILSGRWRGRSGERCVHFSRT